MMWVSCDAVWTVLPMVTTPCWRARPACLMQPWAGGGSIAPYRPQTVRQAQRLHQTRHVQNRPVPRNLQLLAGDEAPQARARVVRASGLKAFVPGGSIRRRSVPLWCAGLRVPQAHAAPTGAGSPPALRRPHQETAHSFAKNQSRILHQGACPTRQPPALPDTLRECEAPG